MFKSAYKKVGVDSGLALQSCQCSIQTSISPVFVFFYYAVIRGWHKNDMFRVIISKNMVKVKYTKTWLD